MSTDRLSFITFVSSLNKRKSVDRIFLSNFLVRQKLFWRFNANKFGQENLFFHFFIP